MAQSTKAQRGYSVLVFLLLLSVLTFRLPPAPVRAAGPCDPPITNPIACENTKPGSPASEWDISGAGSSAIQGFATDISVDQGQPIAFKINTPATAYRLDIYRLGYYAGLGARKVATLQPTVPLPQPQPACRTDATTGLIDCGTWAVSATWTVPADATSGIYLAKLVREDGTAGASHIVFIVRDDDGHAPLLFQTADTTWQAYNAYGGNSLYTGSPDGRAYKVSYNRPFTTRASSPEDWLFNAEYPMLRWLEANGYPVSYASGVDSDRLGAELLEHQVFLSVGHDEYWSGGQRANVEAARNAGVHLAFFSGNESFWKTRWESSSDGTGTPYRTLVSYKETHANAKIDPDPAWTGTWRDPRFSPPADGGRPENALTGTIFMVNCCSYAIQVPAAEGKMRFWRNTSIASLGSGQTATLPDQTLGYEWDEELDNGFRPAGLVHLSLTSVNVPERLLDYGSNYGAGTANHSLTLYRHSSGALVFGAGTIQWSWGLDGEHDRATSTPDPRMQQATVNLLADMGVQPATLQSGLVPASASTDTTAPTSTITSPAGGATVPATSQVTITGTATDSGGGVVGGVEVSTDGGTTWHPATGRESWSYTWQTGGNGVATIKSRAADDSGNLESPSAGTTITVSDGSGFGVVAVSPNGGNAPITSNITITFSQAINPTTFSGSINDAAIVSTQVVLDGTNSIVTIDPGELEYGRTYTVAVDATVTSAGGTALGTPYTFTFTVVGNPNPKQPTTTVVVPSGALQAGQTYTINGQAQGYVWQRDANNPLELRHWDEFGNDIGDRPMLHPTALYFPQGMDGYKFWLIYTPYPSESDENPVLMRSNDGVNFTAAGVPKNPLFVYGYQPPYDSMNLADPEVYRLGNTWMLFYEMETPASTAQSIGPWMHGGGYIGVAFSQDGLNWQPYGGAYTYDPANPPQSFPTNGNPVIYPESAYSYEDASNSKTGEPAVIFKDGRFHLWRTVIDGDIVRVAYDTSASPRGPWSKQGVAVDFGQYGLGPHPDVVYDPERNIYLMLYLTPSGTNEGTLGIYTATSPAGPWTPHPLNPIFTAQGGWEGSRLYRSTLVQVDGQWYMYYSADALTSNGRIGLAREVPGVRRVEVSTNGGTSWQPATVNPDGSWTFNWTPASDGTYAITARVIDDFMQGAQTVATNATVGQATPTCPCSLWGSSATPSNVDSGDTNAVEVGVKFRASESGYITGLRFYKGSTNTGPHTVHLWSSTGTLLATASVTTETASGWQQADLTTPVAIQANTTYVASYHAPAGRYALDEGYFTTAVTSGPLQALANGADGGNGVYLYGPSGSFPTNTYNASNYWVDVVFATTAPTDTTPPVISAVQAGSLTSTSAAISWTTNEPADSQVEYGTTTAYGSSTTLDATLVTSHSQTLTGLTPSTLYHYRVRSRDAAGNLATSADGTFTTAPPDTTPPVISAVQAGSLTSSGATITWSTDEPADSQVEYGTTSAYGSSTTRNAALVTSHSEQLTGLAASTLYHYRVLSRDSAGNLTTSADGTFTTADASACMCSIWSSSATPSTADGGGPEAVEVGVKFRASENGYITGLRFYKGTANTGPHVGHLWTRTGTLLASVTFTTETASGWQEANLPTPVAIQANTTYIASYHAPAGRYALDEPYFTSAVTNGPLQALADGADGGNGVYSYGPSGSFPINTYNATNYWVDVVFATTVPPDTVAPTVASVTPANGATSVATSTNVMATFAEAMDPATITSSTFSLRDATGAAVAATVSYDQASLRAILDPTAALAYTTTYTATLKGGAGGVTDLAGNAMAADYTWTFTTSAPPPPPPDQGPGGPILVIATASNPFGRYFAEILRAEGLNAFIVTDISNVSASTLASYDVVILGEMPLTSAQVTMFTDWVNAGGNLIAMRPDKKLAPLLGLTDAGTTLSDGYLLVNTAAAPGTGIVGETIQFHGAADRYTLSGATSVATLYSSATAATSNPAVTLRSAGSQGGQAAAFTYDLARSIVYTRQGNPAWSGQERDGISPIRSDDLFYGAASADPQPDWVNLDKVAIPQADEQQRLLANLILQMNLDKKPVPRFWYFPSGKKAVVIMTGDDHAVGGTAGRFDRYKSESPANCSVADWECIRATSYIYTGTPLSNTQAAGYQADGFEIAIHVTTECMDWTPAGLEDTFAGQIAEWQAKYTSLSAPATNRTHCIAWSDYVSQPKVELNHGIRLDTNYYYYPPSWMQDRPGLFTGSGIPMRFADLDGTMIDVYQATTQMHDEQFAQTYPFTVDTLLDRALGPEGYYGAFTTNMHTDYVSLAQDDAVVASATSRGVPMVSARQMLTWLDGRNSSSFGALAWSGNTLTFTIKVGAGARNLQAMVPVQAASGRLTSITRDGNPVSVTIQTIKGVEYAFFNATAGNYAATYTVDTTPPTITAVQAGAITSTEATITWTTDEPADSQVEYGTTTAYGSSTTLDGALTTSHSQTLIGLTPNTLYHYRVLSRDAAGNLTTSADGTFTTAPPDTTPPTISAVQATAITSRGATITWTTDEPADSQVEYGTTTAYGSTTTLDATKTTSHAQTLANLTPDMLYHYRVLSRDAAGNVATSGDFTFTTLADGTAPVISGVQATGLSSTRATITWTTDEPADSQVEYGTTTAYGSTTTLSPTLVTSHSLSLAGLTPSTLYHYRVLSRDAAGNLATSGDFTFTTLAPSACPCSIWSDTTTPALAANAGDTSAIEVGVKFRASESGYITGLRFYKGSTNTGPHTAHLWSSTGTLLATASFTTETASGWQQADLTTPVAITANTTYIASYHAPAGRYALDEPYFTNAVTTGPLQALANGADGGNGVYSYGPSGSFPTNTYNASNYWVDVAFVPDAAPPVIANVQAGNLTSSGATITWTTDEPADSQVEYGTTTSYGSSTTLDATLVTSHSQTLTGLTPSTLYHYRVRSRDSAGNLTTSPDATFTTPSPDTTPPVISAVQSHDVTLTSAMISWTTDENATSQVEYGTTTSYGSSTTLDATLVTSHSQTLSGLTANTTYHYRVTSTDAAGNTATAADATFVTSCPCSIWGSSATPSNVDSGDTNAVEVGVKFRASESGYITGLRFYKGSTNTGPHTVHLWSSTGTLLASASVSTETASGWQQADLTTPVAIQANTTYIASYHAPAGHYSFDGAYFTSAVTTGPLQALANGADGPNGLYRYGPSGTFPTDSFNATNYWVDVVFTTTAPADTTPPVISAVQAGSLTSTSAAISWTTDEPADSQVEYGTTTAYGSSTTLDATLVTSHSQTLTGLTPSTLYHYRVLSRDAAGNSATSPDATFTTMPAADTTPPTISAVQAGTITGSGATITWTTDEPADSQVEYGTTTSYGSSTTLDATLVTSHSQALTGLASNTLYHYRVLSRDAAGNLATSADGTFTTTAPTCPCSIWGSSATPSNVDSGDTNAVEVGVKFRASESGYITGLRFYKGSTNTGPHTVHLWSSTGTLLASASVSTETASGWQQADLTTPVAIQANTTYIASYHAPAGHYSFDGAYFTSAVTTGPLQALANGADGPNGLYRYGPSGTFPTDSFNATNYWVDVVFTTTAPADTTPPVISAVQAGSLTSTSAAISWTTDEPADSQVEYGTTTAYGSSTTLDATLTTSHSQTLSGLTANTTYHYRVTSKDAAGNTATSADGTFTTPSSATPSPDTTPPTISAVQAGTITSTGATITWTTDENATSQVEYGPTTSYGSSTTLDSTLVTSHSQSLSGLTANTTYHYRVTSTDAAGNTATAADATFTTTAAADTTAPIITSIQATNITSSGATITWTTDEPADSQVEYGTTTSYGSSTTLDATLTTSHSQTLSGLTASTTYHYRVLSRDAAGNLATSADGTFITMPAADTTPPTISAVQAGTITSSGATITWTTDEPADSQVEYGTTTSYGSSTTLDATLVTSHSQALTGLSSSTLYHYRVRSRDAAGNLATSADATFTTSGTDTAAPVIASVQTTNITSADAVIMWLTNEPASSQVKYGSTAYEWQPPADLTLVTTHSQALANLSPNTLYHYRVISRDAAGNEAISVDAVFVTLAADPAPVSSLSFDGTSSHVQIADSTSLRLTNNLTVEAWIKVSSTFSGRRYIVSKLNSFGLAVEPSGSSFRLRFETSSGGTTRAVVSGAVALNQWHHVAATYNGSRMRLFIDGQQIRNQAAAGNLSGATNPIYMATLDATGSYFPGLIDEVRLSKVVRYTGGYAPITAALTPDAETSGLWHFDEGTGTTIADASGNANIGTLVNGPSWMSDSPFGGAISAIMSRVLSGQASATLQQLLSPNSLTGSVLASVQPRLRWRSA